MTKKAPSLYKNLILEFIFLTNELPIEEHILIQTYLFIQSKYVYDFLEGFSSKSYASFSVSPLVIHGGMREHIMKLFVVFQKLQNNC